MPNRQVRQILRVFSRAWVLILIILLASPAIPAKADTTVCGAITSNTTWTSAGNDYIVNCEW